MSSSIDKIKAKMEVQHPKYPWLRVDMRTQREVEESRNLKPTLPIVRMARSARRKGRSFRVAKDSDGAYRIRGRIDGERGLIPLD